MRDVATIVGMVARRLRSGMYEDRDLWPYTVNVQLPKSSEAELHVLDVHANNASIGRWAEQHGCQVVLRRRKIGVVIDLIDAVTIPDEQTALHVVDRTIAGQYQQARSRAHRLGDECNVNRATALSVAKLLSNESDMDVDLLIRATDFFARYLASHGMEQLAELTPRQVPLAGFSTKWLSQKKSRRSAICRLLNIDSLPLQERPRELRFRHLDPARQEQPDMIATRPWFEGAMLGIRYVVIVENKDTYQAMPAIKNGLCVFGNGHAACDGLQLLPWIADSESTGSSITVVYWGDMDAAGFEILSEVRMAGIDCSSMFMDCTAYHRYSAYGTNLTADSKEIPVTIPNTDLALSHEEEELYRMLCTGEGIPYRRLEQERIPISDAVHELRRRGFPVTDIPAES
ncbi:DUF3322 and DUF2220 domain-containing protein [Bifidobacterium vansinderenii]|uniref:Wadjet protein JetD C-terminal domain-containing protein n=1 Tax=Bifidobacterium vansinderenii TaxID=1984871 RepID=A0A229W0A2_9BIFI|nr:DUF3322 and DUF2220 domain-containing protein [Bifidobacterium vansinderenii]OXN01272.1 hypothetical protein Tam10B_0272 [Bifidobacterium vansinderenii]